jgi:hypothetical protein
MRIVYKDVLFVLCMVTILELECEFECPIKFTILGDYSTPAFCILFTIRIE